MNGSGALPLLEVSWNVLLGSYMSSSVSCFFLPQIRHATTAKAPISIAPPIPTTTPIMMFFCDDVMPELPEPPLPPFKLGESVDVGSLDGEALLVMTREKVLLPLTVTMVVVMRAADSASLEGAAVVVIRAVWLCTGVKDSAVAVGVSLFGVEVGVGRVEVSTTVVGAGVDDAGAAGDDCGREVVATAVEDGDGGGDVDSESDSDSVWGRD